MKTSRTAVAVLVTFLASTVPVSSAFAQDDPVTMQARARFKEGVDFYDKGQYENARLAFLQAYALKKHPAVLLNLAQSSSKAGHQLEAARYFQQYLKESTAATTQQRQDAEAGLAEARTKLGRIDIVAPAGTEITLDEKERLGTAPFAEAVDVEPGAHSLRSSTETVRVTAGAGQRVQAKFGAQSPVVAPVPVPGPAEQPPPPPVTEPPKEPGQDSTQKPLPMLPGYIGIGVAGVGIAGAIIFAAFKADAQSKANTVASSIRTAAGSRSPGICTSTAPTDVTNYSGACATLNDDNNKVDTDATVANVSVAVAIIGAVFATAWLVGVPIINRNRDHSSSSLLKDPSLTPYAGFNSGGFNFSAAF